MENNSKKNLFNNGWFFCTKSLLSTIISFVLFIFPGVVIAASQTYYVTFNGSGSQNGLSYANSWSWSQFLDSGNWSGSEAANKIDPGDTVYLSGTFNIGPGTHNIPGSGTLGNYIIIDGDDGVNTPATISPTYLSGQKSIRTNSNDYLEFRNISFTGGAEVLLFIDKSSYIKVHDITANGNYNRGIYVSWSDNIEIYDNSLTSTRKSYWPDGVKTHRGNSYIYAYRNYLSNWGHTAMEVLAMKGDAASHHVYFYNNYIDLPTRGYGRAFDTTAQTGASVHHVWIYGNYVDSMRAPSQMANVDYIYVYNNIFFNALNCCESANDAGCTEAMPGGACATSRAYLKTGQHIVVHTSYGGSTYVYIYNNVFYKSAEAALKLDVSVENSDNFHIKNNIFYDGANACTQSDSPPGSSNKYGDYPIYAQGHVTNEYTNVTFTNNIVYSPTVQKTIKWTGKSYLLSEFENAYSWASDNITLNPLFTDPDNKDFTLLANSPAIDAGVKLEDKFAFGWNPKTLIPPNSLETLDQNGFGSAWDLGAYIFNSLSKPAPPPNPSPNSPANFGLKSVKG